MPNKTSILLVDDETDYLEAISFWLKSKKKYDVNCARNGKEALEAVKKSTPDIIFLDLMMPVMDGVETLENIRKLNKDVPVVMVTAGEFPEAKYSYSIKKLNELGISGFFKKKDSFDELGNILEVTLRMHRKIKDAGSA